MPRTKLRTTTVDRPFTLLDGMGLIAGAAAWMALVRPALAGPPADVLRHVLDYVAQGAWSFGSAIELVVFLGVLFVGPFVTAMGTTLAVRVLGTPRNERRRLGRQPGVLAGLLIGGMTLVLAPVLACVFMLRFSWAGDSEALWAFGGALASSAQGLIVLTNWPVLGVLGFRPSPTWPDRAGHALGLIAILGLPGNIRALSRGYF